MNEWREGRMDGLKEEVMEGVMDKGLQGWIEEEYRD